MTACLRAGLIVTLAALLSLGADVPTGAIEANSIGVGFMNQYLYTEAAAAFRKALAASRDFNLARINLAVALFYKQDYEDATRLLAEALEREPASATAHYVLGLLSKNQGDLASAETHFRKVIELDGKDAAALYNLGVTQVRLRKGGEAERALRRALELDPINTSVLYNLGSHLLKSGRAEEGNRLLDRFRALQQKGEASSIGNQYGEAGPYALAFDYTPRFVGAAVAARPADAYASFEDRTADAGLAAFGSQATSTPAEVGGVALGDLDNDGDIDAVITRYEGSSSRTLILRNDGRGRFSDATAPSGIVSAGNSSSAAIGDYDNDGLPDVYVASRGGSALFRNLGQGKFSDVTSAAGVAGPGVSGTFVDYDHDGDLDLYVCGSGARGNRMLRNNGNGTFGDVTATLGVAGAAASAGMTATDLDNDRDIDLVVAHPAAPPEIFSNERSDRFSEISERIGARTLSSSHSIALVDIDRDGATDLVVSAGDQGEGALLRNRGNGVLERDTRSPELVRALGAGERAVCGAFDFDNDGDLDLYVFAMRGRAALWENAGDGRFVFAGRLRCDTPGRAAAAADFDGDGRTDILYLDYAGSPRLLANADRSARHWIAVRLEGLRSNKAGLGARVEVRAGGLYQKLEVSGHAGYLSQEGGTLWVGLGAATKADTVTVRWPSGILQSEINAPADRVLRVKELDRKGTSCPLLYAWNGRGFEFVTDFLGGSAFGYLVAPGHYNTPDSDEYVRIEGKQLQPRDGRYLLNLNNQLEEVILFDRAQLLVVDHPEGIEVYPNERLMPAPPFPEHRIWTAARARPPRSAVDARGNDILAAISALDRVYPPAPRALPFKGYAEEQAITLDLGDLAGAAKVLLLMDAWIDYADSSSNLAASQAGVALIPPYLQVRDRSGKWTTVLPSMGFPAGLPKTMTVDLTGRFLSSDAHVRVVTNMKIHWDRIRVDTSPQIPVRARRLDPVAADLHFRGYPTYYSPDGKLPWIYDYSRIAPSETWGTHAGAYTRFGDVRELLLAVDDRFVITRHGDEITLAFDAALVPGPAPGWTRDFLLHADGFGKDMDLNSLYPDAIEPLPFHAMSRFPYGDGERYPGGEAHRAYRRTYNTRVFPVVRSRAPITAP